MKSGLRQHTVKINLPSKESGIEVSRRPCPLNDTQTLALVVYLEANSNPSNSGYPNPSNSGYH